MQDPLVSRLTSRHVYMVSRPDDVGGIRVTPPLLQLRCEAGQALKILGDKSSVCLEPKMHTLCNSKTFKDYSKARQVKYFGLFLFVVFRVWF